MRVIAIITDPGECKHSLEVNKILECLKRNNAPPFDKDALKASLFSCPYTSMKEELIGVRSACPYFQEYPVKLCEISILDKISWSG